LCPTLITDLGIGFKDASCTVSVLCPRPVSIRRVESLTIQEGDNELLQKCPELEFWLKELVLIERTAKAGAVVALIEVPFCCGVYALDVERR